MPLCPLRRLACSSPLADTLHKYTCFVSINRFDPKKDIGKGIRAFALLANKMPASEFKELRFIVAGGYDEKVRSCIEYKRELTDLSKALGVIDQVRTNALHHTCRRRIKWVSASVHNASMPTSLCIFCAWPW
jgi:glycosyltransferase involved in cell wall biosynthesis